MNLLEPSLLQPMIYVDNLFHFVDHILDHILIQIQILILRRHICGERYLKQLVILGRILFRGAIVAKTDLNPRDCVIRNAKTLFGIYMCNFNF